MEIQSSFHRVSLESLLNFIIFVPQNICDAKVFVEKKFIFREQHVLVLETESSKCWLRIPVEHCYQLGLCPCISHLLGSEGFNNRSSQTLEDRRGKAILNEGGDFLHIPSIRQSHVWAHVNFEIKHSSMNSNEIKTGKIYDEGCSEK